MWNRRVALGGTRARHSFNSPSRRGSCGAVFTRDASRVMAATRLELPRHRVVQCAACSVCCAHCSKELSIAFSSWRTLKSFSCTRGHNRDHSNSMTSLSLSLSLPLSLSLSLSLSLLATRSAYGLVESLVHLREFFALEEAALVGFHHFGLEEA